SGGSAGSRPAPRRSGAPGDGRRTATAATPAGSSSVAVAGSSPAVSPAGDLRATANRRRLPLLCATGGLVPGLVAGLVLGFAVGSIAGVVAGVVVLVAAALWLARGALPLALRTVGGRPAADGELPALVNLVEGLGATFGVRAPQLWLVDDPVGNACTVAGTSGRAVLVVTTGLVGQLDLIELEGVVAHEMAHVKCHDAAVSAVAVATVGMAARMTGVDRWVHSAVGYGREYAADRRAVLGVRYPPGLRDALAVLSKGPSPVPGSVFTGGRWAATRWLWIDPMVGRRGHAAEGQLDATAVRRDALAEW
ncbi:MAG: M48 family metalloprotease, partial [Acidimicrobiales bacterium]